MVAQTVEADAIEDYRQMNRELLARGHQCRCNGRRQQRVPVFSKRASTELPAQFTVQHQGRAGGVGDGNSKHLVLVGMKYPAGMAIGLNGQQELMLLDTGGGPGGAAGNHTRQQGNRQEGNYENWESFHLR